MRFNDLPRRERRQRWRRIEKQSRRAGDGPLTGMEAVGSCLLCSSEVHIAPPEMSRLILIEEGVEPEPAESTCGVKLYLGPDGDRVVACAGCGRADLMPDGLDEATSADLTAEAAARAMGMMGGEPGSPCAVPCTSCGSQNRTFGEVMAHGQAVRCNDCGQEGVLMTGGMV